MSWDVVRSRRACSRMCESGASVSSLTYLPLGVEGLPLGAEGAGGGEEGDVTRSHELKAETITHSWRSNHILARMPSYTRVCAP